MKITLIQPPKPSYGVVAEDDWELARPFSLFYLASAVEKYTPFDVEIIDLEKKIYSNISLDDVFLNNDSKVFGITATTFTRFEAIRIAQSLKKMYPACWIVAGGVHFSYCAEDTLANVPEIDIIVRGEGERILVELLQTINKGKSLDDIKGLSFRSNNKIINNQNQIIFEDLDDLPFYDKFSWDEYPEYLMGYSADRIPAISIMSSRGCPYSCIFCSKSGTKYRLRDPKKVVDEIEVLRDKYNIKAFNFLDLTFTASPQHVKGMCRELIVRKMDIKWWCESRVNIPLELLDLMKQAGCVSVVIGVESGSPRIISQIQKNISLDQVVSFCRKCIDVGIIVSPYFMYSHPGETLKDVNKTIAFMRKLKKIGANVGGFQPTMVFPGSKIEEIARSKGILPKNFSWSAPYESEYNRELGQLPNVPLFIDAIPIDGMKMLNSKLVFEYSVAGAAEELSHINLMDSVFRAVRAIIRKDPIVKYMYSPRFYYEYIISKLRNRR